MKQHAKQRQGNERDGMIICYRSATMRQANTATNRGAKKPEAIVSLPFAENRGKVTASACLIQNRCATPLYMSITASAKCHSSTAAHETTRGERRKLQPSNNATQACETAA